MTGDPSCQWKSFKEAKLRRFPDELSTFHWEKYIGTGEDGVVLEARLDDARRVAVKIVSFPLNTQHHIAVVNDVKIIE